MPTTIPFVFGPEDEQRFCDFLSKYELVVYPERVPPGWVPFKIDGESWARLDEPSYYLAADRLGPVQLRSVKRGKDKGFDEVNEVDSPVLHYQRSYTDELGQLRSGRIWCELNLTGDMQRNPAFPDSFRRILVQIREHMYTQYHRSNPRGWVVGQHAAKLSKAGVPLREEGRKGILLAPYLER